MVLNEISDFLEGLSLLTKGNHCGWENSLLNSY